MKTVHEVLVDARNLIDRQGWQPTYGFDPDGPQCAVSALSVVTKCDVPYCEVRAALAAVLGCRDSSVSIGFWNDAQNSPEPVLAAFDKAIAATAPEPADPFPSEQLVEVPA